MLNTIWDDSGLHQKRRAGAEGCEYQKFMP